MRRPSTLPVVLLLVLGALAGCGNDSSKATKHPSPSTSTTLSASASAGSGDRTPSSGVSAGSAGASGFPRDQTEATSLHKAVLASSSAKTPAERAAVAAWMRYWQGVSDTNYYYHPTKQFTNVATGTARTGILKYLQQKKDKHRRVVGWSRDNVTMVEVTGDSAKIVDCTENYTFTVDQEAEPLTRPDPFYATTGTLQRVDGRWLVVTQDSKPTRKSCLS